MNECAVKISVKYLGQKLSNAERLAVWGILVDCDNDFFPPLSMRESSHQAVLVQEKSEVCTQNATKPDTSADKPGCPDGLVSRCSTGTGPGKYFDEMIRQDFILAYADGEIAGFLTFRRNYSCAALAEIGPSIYITTICVAPARRKLGIMSALYDCLETEVAESLSTAAITTRTWSLNAAQLHTLAKRGYSLVSRLRDDRGPGVDTVYFGLKLKNTCQRNPESESSQKF